MNAAMTEHFKRLAAIRNAKKLGLRPPPHNAARFWDEIDRVFKGEILEQPKVIPLRPTAQQ